MTYPLPDEDGRPDAPLASAGWYTDRLSGRQRWWDGSQWGEERGLPAQLPPAPPHLRPAPANEKSTGVASLLTFLFPGAGHLYLGDNKKAMPYLIANSIGMLMAFTIYLVPLALLVWIVTLVMTLPGIKADTNRANDEASADHQRRWGIG